MGVMKSFVGAVRGGLGRALLGTLLALGAARVSEGTILTFDITGGSPVLGNDQLMPQDYGDNVAGASQIGQFGRTYGYLEGNGWTPNVTVGYRATGHGSAPAGGDPIDRYKYWGVAQNWNRVAYLHSSGETTASFFTTFTPDSPYVGVRVNSFDIVSYQTSSHGFSWWLYGDEAVAGGELFASGEVVSGGDGPNSWATLRTEVGNFVTIETGLDDFYFGDVVLVIRHTAGTGNVFAMDNVNFDQIIAPEPASAALLLAGALGMAAVGCHKRFREKPART